MPDDPHSVFSEPLFLAPKRETDAAEHEVWSEPGLMPEARPADAR
jgi:hypothetical protein